MFAFLACAALSETYILSAFCPCDVTPGIADEGCSCDPLAKPNAADSYPIRAPDELPKCPRRHFKRDEELGQWLRDEIFCVETDKRSVSPKSTFPDSFNVTWRPTRVTGVKDDDTPSDAGYSYAQEIRVADGTALKIPGKADGTSGCALAMQSILFMQNVQESVCTLPSNRSEYEVKKLVDAITAQAIKVGPTSDQTINPVVQTVESSAVLLEEARTMADTSITKQIALTIEFDPSTMTIAKFGAVIEFYTVEPIDAQLTVTVAFVGNSTAKTPKSGDVGYSFGQPVIAARSVPGYGLAVSNNAKGSFPMPFGATCASARYTPLLFGTDTITGCTGRGTQAVDLSDYKYFAIYGRANPAYPDDWVEAIDNCTKADPDYQKLYFYYEKFGDVTNAQNRLVSVFRECSEEETSDTKVVTATFLQRRQEAFRYKPPNPRLPDVPSDTFHPFR